MRYYSLPFICGLSVFLCTGALAANRVPLAIGAAAPEFALPGIDGKTHRLTDYTKDVLAILFTCNHCPTAQAYEERIKQLQKDYEGKSVDLVAISPNSDKAVRPDELGYAIVGDSLEEMKVHAKVYGLTFPYLYDGETQSVAEAFGVIATPHIYVFGKDRKLAYQGRIDDDESGQKITSQDARITIDALLAGNEPPVKETRVFGCSTKWAEKAAGAVKAEETWNKRPVTLETVTAAGVKKLAANATDKLRLINVWATWCGPCVTEFPELVMINRIYQRRGLELVTLSVDDVKNEKAVLTFLQREHAALSKPIAPSLEKEDRTSNNYLYSGTDKDAFADALDAEWRGGYPHTVLVAPGGKVLYRQTGEIDPLALRQEIVKFLGRTYQGRQWGN